jgi:hypothetical protein
VVVVVLLLVAGLTGGLLVATRRVAPAAEPARCPAVPPTRPAPPPTSAPAPPGGLTGPPAVRAVEAAVEQLRSLRFRHPVPVTVESPDRLARRLRRINAAENDEADLARQGRALAQLGELPQGTDLPKLLASLEAESVLGFYVPGKPPKGRLYVRSNRGLDPYARIVLAHELTHAVTDQHFDLTRGDRLGAAGLDDQQAAYAALAEGDATYVMGRYATERLSGAERAEAARVAAGEQTPLRDAAPAAVRQALLFPYQEGLQFVRFLYQTGGAAAVDRAYQHPPDSTEQILHPAKFLGRRDLPQPVAVPDLAGRLGAGWRSAADTGFGEFDARLLLADRLPVAVAEDAAAGWDGGRLRSFERDGRMALVLRTVWDSPAEARQWCTALGRWATARFGASTGGGGQLRWSAPSQQGALVCGGSRAAWLQAPDRSALDRLAGGLGGP